MSEEQIQVVADEPEENLSELLQVRRDKLNALVSEGNDPYLETKYERTAWTEEIQSSFETMEGATVSIAGRIMAKRGMGKAIFADIRDDRGRVQIYVKLNEVGEEAFAAFRKVDIGDIVGAEGTVFKTRMGEISVQCTKLKLLSKSLRPLPEKFHGLTDKETRYRKRYLDLIMNPDVRKAFEIRSRFISYMRRYLDDRGYMEVETPVLNTVSAGASARPFITHHNTLDLSMYMRIATELNLKKLIVGGIERVYEIGRIFRNEGMDTRHNPEFTTVELYEAYADFHDMMDIAEGIISGFARDVLGGYTVEWMGEQIDLTPGWQRLTMADAVKQYTGLDFMAMDSDEAAIEAAKSIGVELSDKEDKTWGNALYACFDRKVEDKIIQPTFITMYPVEVSTLTKRSKEDPRLTERFELFICKSEIANAYSELNDPVDQRGRLEKQAELRARGDEEAEMTDEEFLDAMEYGMPPTGGMGIGIDRTVMMLTNSASIRDVILFPTMKPTE